MITEFMPLVDQASYYLGTLTPDIALSQTIAHELVSRSAKHAWAKHPRLGGKVFPPSDEMVLGNVLDELVLGGSKRIQELPFEAFRSNEAKAARDAALASGKIPIKSHKLADYRDMADRAVKALEFAGVRLNGLSQVCLLWAETASNGNEVQCCALLDHVHVDAGLIRDLKTGDDCRPSKLGRKTHDYAYHLQSAAYVSGFEHVFPAWTGRSRFQNVWMETSWPNVVVLSEPDGEAMHVGRLLWQRAVDRWEECVRTRDWPAYTKPGEVLRVALPGYALDEALASEESEVSDAA